MIINNELQLAHNFVNHTNRNIFLTGKAGTGKTTFLHELKKTSLKRMVVVAPTGVAAINAKGVTIHSFFQLPFGPILPNQDINAGQNFKISKTKINILRSLDLLVIDEISMVRADLLDGIDVLLRRFKNKALVFGGVQVLMIGDLQQLSPVVKDSDWQILKSYYKNGFFFSSLAYQQCQAITIELKHIYRQDNPKFIEILNEIRTNTLSIASANALNKRFDPIIDNSQNKGYISLTTHNHKAETVNLNKLNQLKTKVFKFKGSVEGKFPEHSYPNKLELQFKVGSQVMFIKNDNSQDKLYFNGKIGVIKEIDKDEIVVRCPNDDFDITAKSQEWENINYTVDKATNAITENKIGSFKQMPLRLAWAITIHKSQGLTFEKAIIDAQDAFAHGQTYVALSRCKSLEGLILRSKIEPRQIINDQNVTAFHENAEANAANEAVLKESETEFQLQLISELFNFYSFLYPSNRLLDIYYNNRTSIKGTLETPMLTIKDAVTKLLKVGHGFNAQLKTLVKLNETPEGSDELQERFVKGISYFSTEVASSISTAITEFKFTTDNRTLESDIDKQFTIIEEALDTKLLYFEHLKTGFNTKVFLELRAKGVFLVKDNPTKQTKKIFEGTSNVQLFELLRVLRNDIAERNDLVHFQVFTQKSLYNMCETLPITKTELKLVHGMGKTRIEKYGTEILQIIKTYCEINTDVFLNRKKNAEEAILKKKNTDTKKTSLDLFKKGKPIEQIALERDLKTDTIIGHLASFITTNEIKTEDLISVKNYKALKKAIPKLTFENLTDLKQQLDAKFTYTEIRLVMDELAR